MPFLFACQGLPSPRVEKWQPSHVLDPPQINMPRRHARRTRRHRRRMPRRRGLTTRQAAFRALARVDPERKNFDGFVNVTAVFVGTPVIFLLNGMPEGTTNETRIGSSCKILSFQMKWQAAHAASSQFLRIMLLIDRQTNQTLPTEPNILTDPGLPVISTMNLNNSKRFKIVMNRVIRVDVQGPEITYGSIYKRMSLKPRYNGAGAGIGNLATGSLVLYVSSSAAIQTDGPSFQAHTRLRFVG